MVKFFNEMSVLSICAVYRFNWSISLLADSGLIRRISFGDKNRAEKILSSYYGKNALIRGWNYSIKFTYSRLCVNTIS